MPYLFPLVLSLNWLFWLFTLNSCLNPWIYMAFNPELVYTLFGPTCKCFGPPGNANCSPRGAAHLNQRAASSVILRQGLGNPTSQDEPLALFSPTVTPRKGASVSKKIFGRRTSPSTVTMQMTITAAGRESPKPDTTTTNKTYT